MTKSFDLYLVSLSVIVAVFVSNTSLSLFLRFARSQSCSRRMMWLIGGGVVMGCGIWASHFIGMMALAMPVPLTYDWTTTGLSLAIAVAASIIALSLVTDTKASVHRIAASALMLGSGIAAMHYLGMYAIQITPGLHHDPLLASLSLLVGFAGAYAAIWVLFRGQQWVGAILAKALAACLLGVAVGGLHYLAIWATRFAPGSICHGHGAASGSQLGMIVGAVAIGLMALTSTLIMFEEHVQERMTAYNTQLLGANAQLEHAATHDALTGLPNRLLFRRELDDQVARTAAHTSTVPFGVLLIDLDRFKEINDSLGHQAGDQLLCELSRRMHEHLPPGSLLARLGGDEFVVLIMGFNSAEEALEQANALQRVISAPVSLCELDVHVTASIGMAMAGEAVTAQLLMQRADAAMYHVKNNGRSGCTLFSSSIQIASRERLEIDDGLHKALYSNQFELHYQPKLDVNSCQVRGAEALIRWRHPRRGLIAPGKFIPLAEETGLIVPIGEWALREACRQIAAWRQSGLGDIQIAVNVSPHQLDRGDFAEVVRGVLAESCVDPRLLELEFTETTLMKDPEQSILALRKLAALGVRIALDDFGTGYSSLSYLRKLPLAALKIDRSFMADLHVDQNASEIVRAIVALSHSLKLKVIAEGVETADHLQFLRDTGCEEFQGYFFSPPVPRRAFETLVRMSRTARDWKLTRATENLVA